MGIFKWFGGFLSNLSDHAGWQVPAPQTTTVSNSQSYTPEQGLQVSTVWACVDLLSRSIASLPINVYQINADGSKIKDTQCNLNYIVSISPNYVMTPFEFWQTMVMNWALRGNAYALIVRKTDKTVKALYPLSPDQMKVYLADDGSLVYQYYDRNNRIIKYKADQILHWKCMGNGVVGLSKLEYMRASLTESALSQETAVDLYANRGKVNGILTTTSTVNKQQKREIAEAFQASRINGGVPVLPCGLDFKQMSLSPADTQLLETRKFTVEELCRWFSVPPALINTDGGASGSNIEQVTINFYKTTILPICRSLEHAIMKRLPCKEEKYNHEISFFLPFLLRATEKDRCAMNAQAAQNGFKTRNEIRAEDNMPPLPGGDELTCQNNLVPLSMLGRVDSSQTPQTPLTVDPIRQ